MRGPTLIKQIGLLKRRADMSVSEFRAYYESHHRLLGEKYLAGFASRYVRRYLDPLAPDAQGEAYDVILEVWYADESAWDRCRARLSEPEVAAEIAADEEQLFERAANRFYTVQEFESQLDD